jgi:hypothetical protein
MRFLYDLPEDAKQRLGEVLADPRRRAERVQIPGGHMPPAECGTRGGYEKHRRAGEPTCEDCKAAEREAKRRRKVAV